MILNELIFYNALVVWACRENTSRLCSKESRSDEGLSNHYKVKEYLEKI